MASLGLADASSAMDITTIPSHAQPTLHSPYHDAASAPDQDMSTSFPELAEDADELDGMIDWATRGCNARSEARRQRRIKLNTIPYPLREETALVSFRILPSFQHTTPPLPASPTLTHDCSMDSISTACSSVSMEDVDLTAVEPAADLKLLLSSSSSSLVTSTSSQRSKDSAQSLGDGHCRDRFSNGRCWVCSRPGCCFVDNCPARYAPLHRRAVAQSGCEVWECILEDRPAPCENFNRMEPCNVGCSPATHYCSLCAGDTHGAQRCPSQFNLGADGDFEVFLRKAYKPPKAHSDRNRRGKPSNARVVNITNLYHIGGNLEATNKVG